MQLKRGTNELNRAKLIERDGNECSVCGTRDVRLDVHHVIPLNQGGINSIANMALVCPNCHRSQHSFPPEQVREFDFEDYIFTLLTLNQDFKNVRKQITVQKEPRLLADIIAEERIDGRWQQVLIECQSSTSFSRDRLLSVVNKLQVYQVIIPVTRIVLAFPGSISGSAYKNIQTINLNIEIWDLHYLSQRFANEIPQVQHPILQSLLSGEKQSLTESPEELLIEKLELCKPGRTEWVAYQHLVGNILEHLFCPPLSPPLKENADALAINRRDFIFPNYIDGEFWAFLRDKYSADYIVVDAKNYVGKIKKEQVLQIANYLKPHGAGLFGLIVCRNGGNRSCMLTLREVWIVERKLIIILTDYDLKEMLAAKSIGTRPESIIRQKIEDFRLDL
ncbi:HNH endonuclease [Chloroflexota bacterium]